MSLRSSNNRTSGITLIELLIAMVILIVLLGVAGAAVTSSLRVKVREVQLVEMQQNLRSALQLITQDARAGAFLHVWHSSDCSHGVCSDDSQVALITTDGVMTTIPVPPGSSYNNSSVTGVCDARGFSPGDLAIISSGDGSAQLIEVTGVTLHADYSEPCKGPHGSGPPNRDDIQHNKHKLSGAWTTSNHMFRAVLATYSLVPDPLDANRTALYRRTGLGSAQEQTGIVAFDVADLRIEYGVPTDPDDAASQMIFYSTLEEAAAALGPGYSAYPTGGTATNVGSIVRAVRISLTGRTARPLDSTGEPGELTLVETVEFRR